MKIELNLNKSIYENISEYYEKSKKIRKKIEHLKKEIKKTEKEMEKIKKEDLREYELKKKAIKIQEKKEWYEKFHYFFTSEGKLAIGGKNASQNDKLFRNYLEKNDIVFHADIPGASLLILKNGVNASDQEKLEVAQFSVSFSNFWKLGNAYGNTYCIRKEQIGKGDSGTFVAKGSFTIKGEREWFKRVPLKLKIVFDNKIKILPALYKRKYDKELYLIPGNEKKEKVVKQISYLFNVHTDVVQEILPPGKIKIIKK